MNWMIDNLIRIKNAGLVEKQNVYVRGTKVSLNVLKILKEEGFIKDYYSVAVDKKKQNYSVVLSYYKEIPLIKDIKFISTSKNRIYKGVDELKSLIRSFKFYLISTNKGIMSCKDAIEQNLGGEVLFSLGV